MTRAAVAYDATSPLEVVEIDIPQIRDHDVLVRFMASGLCHTDVSISDGSLPVSLPIIPGHEGAGIVEAVGAAVSAVKPGDHVALAGVISCGKCWSCLKGIPNLCEWGLPTIMGSRQPDGDLRSFDAQGNGLHQWACLGTFADRGIVPEQSVIPIAKDVPFDVAAVIGCGVLTGVGAVIHRSSVRPGDSVVVLGCGGVGLNAIQGARLAGATTIIAVDPAIQKLALASELGATHTVKGVGQDALEEVRAMTSGRGADAVIECVGKTDMVALGWEMLNPAGTLVTVGVPPAGAVAQLPGDQLWSTEKSLRASLFGSGEPKRDIGLLIELYRQGRLKVAELITRKYALTEINTAVDDLLALRNAKGVIVFE